MQVRHNIGKTLLHKKRETTSQYITNTCFCVESPHYLAWFLVSIPNVIKTLLHGFDPYITFYLCSKCSMFFGVNTHRNAMKRSIEMCLSKGQKEEKFMRSVQSIKIALIMHNWHMHEWINQFSSYFHMEKKLAKDY